MVKSRFVSGSGSLRTPAEHGRRALLRPEGDGDEAPTLASRDKLPRSTHHATGNQDRQGSKSTGSAAHSADPGPFVVNPGDTVEVLYEPAKKKLRPQ